MGTWVVRVAAIVALGVGSVAVYLAAHPALPSGSARSSAQAQLGGPGTSSAGHHRSSRQHSGGLKSGLSKSDLNPAVGYKWMKVSTSWVGHSATDRTEVVTAGSSGNAPARGAVVIRVLNQHTQKQITARLLHPAGTGALTIVHQVGPDKLRLTAENGHTYELKVSTGKLVKIG